VSLTLDAVTADYAPGTAVASRALEGVSLSVAAGELLLVLGPTGSGKTTLLRAAAGLLPLAAGAVEIDGAPLAGPASCRGAVALLFQRPEAQFFALSVEEDCAFGPRNLGRSVEESQADARAALAEVGLDPAAFGPREPWTLSGGEARRVALAGVLAMGPRYLLLDEPTAGLDAEGREAVLAAVGRARRTAGVIVVTHDPDGFVDRADEVLVLKAGRTAFSGGLPEFVLALPDLVSSGAAEPPEVARTLMLGYARAGVAPGELTLDPGAAAARLARLSTRAEAAS
jgi:energy-coupling factor transporter ATP-binding protein EcfA2